MAISPIKYSTPSSWEQQEPFLFDALALRITQLAVQVLFSCVMIWMGVALLPLAYREVTVLSIALGSTFIGASFFDSEPVLSVQTIVNPEAPRAIIREGNNCWVNSMLHLLLSSKVVSKQIRESENFPKRLAPLRAFYRAYDRAVSKGRSTVSYRSQKIREMVAKRSKGAISPLSSSPEDVHEGLKFILRPKFYPEAVKIEERAHYNMEGVSPMAQSRDGIKEKTDLCLDLSVAISGEAPFKLDQMLESYFNEIPEDQTVETLGTDGIVHRYKANKVKRQYVKAPSELWIQIKRFEYVKPSSPQERGRFLKNGSAVQIPNEISVQPKEGPQASYRLKAHVNHTGAYGGGHYMAYRQEGDILYCCNDRSITLVAPEDQEAVRSQAYLLLYEQVV